MWNSRWTHNGEYRRPRILYLSDRNILVDDHWTCAAFKNHQTS
jgi:hypothetical protein